LRSKISQAIIGHGRPIIAALYNVHSQARHGIYSTEPQSGEGSPLDGGVTQAWTFCYAKTPRYVKYFVPNLFEMYKKPYVF
jgi:hypothetical protein